MTQNEKGSATLHSLFAALLLVTALAAATLWSTVSTARHKLATAADLTALSAAQSLTASETTSTPTTSETTSTHFTPPPNTSGSYPATSNAIDSASTSPCAVAARIAALHKVDLLACDPTPTSVTVQVALDLRLPFTHPTLTTIARAGPL